MIIQRINVEEFVRRNHGLDLVNPIFVLEAHVNSFVPLELQMNKENVLFICVLSGTDRGSPGELGLFPVIANPTVVVVLIKLKVPFC